MADRCPACGEVTGVSACPSCGAELLTGAADEIRAGSDRDQTASDQDQTWSDHDQTGASGISEAPTRISTPPMRITRQVATRPAITAPLCAGRSSHNRGAVAVLRDESAAARLGTAEDRDQAAALRDRAPRAVMHWLVCTINRTTRTRAAKTFSCAPSGSAHELQPIAPRQPTTVPGQPPTGKRQPVNAPRGPDAHRIRRQPEARGDRRMTGAWTRRVGLEEVSHELERAHRTGATLLLAFIDIDGLKEVNDRHGHLAGDALLTAGRRDPSRECPLLRRDRPLRRRRVRLRHAEPQRSEAKARFERITSALTTADPEHSVTFRPGHR